MILLLIAVAASCILVERLWPANALPRVDAWWGRIALVNAIQLGIVLLAGATGDQWLARASLFHLSDQLGDAPAAIIAYLVSTFVYYWWHRLRHESPIFWRLCHQLHHSPRRIELLTSFYKHPAEIFINSILSSAIVFALLGCSAAAASCYVFLIAVAEYFYHWNIRTPRWIGRIVQRPESHRIHHRHRHHTQNFADLPVWDMLFGTFQNAGAETVRCGFDPWREARFEDMLAARDVHAPTAETLAPLHFLPTCIGCSKRWACHASREQAAP